MPSGGSASSSSPLAASIASSEPIRARWTGWTAVTTPIRGWAIRARSAISPPTYMPISRTAASCSGPSRRTVSGRPTSLFWLPSLRSVRNRLREDRRDGLLGRGLGDAPGHPDDERAEPAPPAGRHRAERRQRVRDAHDRDVAEDRRVGDGPGHDDGRRAALDRVGHEGVPVDVLAGQGHEQLAGLDQARIDGGAADGVVGAGEEPAAGQAGQVVGGEDGRRDRSLRPGRRVDVGHGRQCRTGRPHRAAVGVGDGVWVRRGDRSAGRGW